MNFRMLVNNALLGLRRKSPQIRIIAGVVGMGCATVMACRATRKLDPVLEEHRERLDSAREACASEESDTHSEGQKLFKVYLTTGGKLIRLYGPSAIVSILSASSALTGGHIFQERTAALAAAYAATDTAYKEYRARAAEKYGPDAERELAFNGQSEMVETKAVDTGGHETVKQETVSVMGENTSPYARYFVPEETNAWEESSEYNRFFINAQEDRANEQLRVYGYLTLNDVYDSLGLQKSVAGQMVGWVYDPEDSNHGDNYVDFGMQKVWRRNALGEAEEVILLDFNVDGDILSRAKRKGLMRE